MITRKTFFIFALLVIAAAVFVQISRAHKQKKTTGGFDTAVESVKLASVSPDDYDEKGGGNLYVNLRNVSEKPIASLRFKQTDTGNVDLKTFLTPFQPNEVTTYVVPFGPSGHFVVLVGVAFADGTTEGER